MNFYYHEKAFNACFTAPSNPETVTLNEQNVVQVAPHLSDVHLFRGGA